MTFETGTHKFPGLGLLDVLQPDLELSHETALPDKGLEDLFEVVQVGGVIVRHLVHVVVLHRQQDVQHVLNIETFQNEIHFLGGRERGAFSAI